MFSVAPNILLAPNMTQNAERKHRTQDANTAHNRLQWWVQNEWITKLLTMAYWPHCTILLVRTPSNIFNIFNLRTFRFHNTDGNKSQRYRSSLLLRLSSLESWYRNSSLVVITCVTAIHLSLQFLCFCVSPNYWPGCLQTILPNYF